jgi:hypothetical protein
VFINELVNLFGDLPLYFKLAVASLVEEHLYTTV